MEKIRVEISEEDNDVGTGGESECEDNESTESKDDSEFLTKNKYVCINAWI